MSQACPQGVPLRSAQRGWLGKHHLDVLNTFVFELVFCKVTTRGMMWHMLEAWGSP